MMRRLIAWHDEQGRSFMDVMRIVWKQKLKDKHGKEYGYHQILRLHAAAVKMCEKGEL